VSPKAVEQLKYQVKRLSAGDYTGLWLVAKRARELLPDASDDQIRSLSLSALSDLLRDGTIVVGDPTPGGGFKPWNLTLDQALQRISEEWDILGHAPTRGGEIADFTTPD